MIKQENTYLGADGLAYCMVCGEPVEAYFPPDSILGMKKHFRQCACNGLLIRSSGGFSKPNHLYMRIPCIELISEPDVKQTDENKTSIGMKSCPSFSRKTASSMDGNVPPSKVKEKYNFSNKIGVNYEYEEGDSL